MIFNSIINLIHETCIMYTRKKSWPSVMLQIIHIKLFAFRLNIISDTYTNKNNNSTAFAKDITNDQFLFYFNEDLIK